ncbi:hypothetical protein HI113_03815 [Corallococcus exiguus]|uniref:hypothetical protein n=1 Tax=Corallococcus exiguus TaxID=83462 RepID=UPI0014767689|nr:hypothetical protein [Corallococcus exiguus]NNB93037.1 hypothetical protein [Corallococcus exiguus]
MLEAIEELRGASSEQELSARFGQFLGLSGGVPLPTLRRAIIDDRFALHLILSRNQPRALKMLFRDPRNTQYENTEAPEQHSNLELLWKAGKAIAKWGATGFEKIDPKLFEDRFSACQGCEKLVEPPNRVLYKVKLSGASDQRICSACGCVAARKARVPTERCPVADPTKPGLNRWGQPLPTSKE